MGEFKSVWFKLQLKQTKNAHSDNHSNLGGKLLNCCSLVMHNLMSITGCRKQFEQLSNQSQTNEQKAWLCSDSSEFQLVFIFWFYIFIAILELPKMKMDGTWKLNRLLCSQPVDATETVAQLHMAKAISLAQKVISLYLINLTEVMKRNWMINLHHHQWGILCALAGCFLKKAQQAVY